MTKAEFRKLETILAKVETLQNKTNDLLARERLGTAKDELLRLHSCASRERALP